MCHNISLRFAFSLDLYLNFDTFLFSVCIIVDMLCQNTFVLTIEFIKNIIHNQVSTS